jgi:hypothetical protein
MMGRRPYPGVHRKEYKEKIINTVVQLKADELPEGWSEDCRDIINKLLQRKEDIRLGRKGPGEIKDHPWFKDINWEDMLSQRVAPPFIPPSVMIKVF